MEAKPDSFNWVKALSDCSMATVFQILLEIVKSNVNAANTLKQRDTTYTVTPLDRKFMVIRETDLAGVKESSNVVFELASREIKVSEFIAPQPVSALLFSARPSFNEDGECMLEVDGKPLKLWQVSRRALQRLFFGG